MNQITKIAVLSVMLFGFALGNAVLAENPSASDTSDTQDQHSEKRKVTNRLEKLHWSWMRKKKKTKNKQHPLPDASKKPTGLPLPARTTVTTPGAASIGLQTPQLPKPFYADTHYEGNRQGGDLGVQFNYGWIYILQIEKEVTEEGISRSVGGSAEFELSHVPTFFTRTRDVLLFVPKKIGVGVRYLGRGIKHLLRW
ncbi:hypothetical protein F4Y19_15420 [Candidatus Poribacteria bacterium]|nr:hypothetical protein [Candidatus Poribacteria bacterium]